jgi:hypothetical protein
VWREKRAVPFPSTRQGKERQKKKPRIRIERIPFCLLCEWCGLQLLSSPVFFKVCEASQSFGVSALQGETAQRPAESRAEQPAHPHPATMAGVRLSSAQLLAGLQQLGPAASPSKTTVAFLTFKAQVRPLSAQRGVALCPNGTYLLTCM